MKERRWVVAVDGPAGAGKSTIAKMVAHELGFRYVDTGAMYRALTWKAMAGGISFHSPEALAHLARTTRLRFIARDGAFHIFADGEDVGHRIRTARVTKLTNTLAAVPAVRRILRNKQRQIGRTGGVVMEGRDIGTAVFPKADVKFYLDASPAERARRRFKELKAKGRRVSLKAITDAIRRRDHRDRTRRVAPLTVAPDANVLDTTKLSLQETVHAILSLINGLKRKRQG